jgi:hypothetical protein
MHGMAPLLPTRFQMIQVHSEIPYEHADELGAKDPTRTR